MRDVVILGSTGSIGTQALEVIADRPDEFRVVGLAAGGGQVELLARQVLDTQAAVVGVTRATAVQDLQLALYAEAQRRGWAFGRTRLPRIVAGPDAASGAGRAGLRRRPQRDHRVGRLAGHAGRPGGRQRAGAGQQGVPGDRRSAGDRRRPRTGQLVAVDSEHSALAQCLRGGSAAEVDRLILTASGGPFRGWTREQMRDVTPEQALAHPTWDMGRVITTNSATLVNKGLELLEAHLLYGVDLDRIDVVVHPQSMVHSMVQFVDGATLAQCSPPDMKLPIALGLELARPAGPGVPTLRLERRRRVGRSSRWTTRRSRRSSSPGRPDAGGGSAPAVYNAANEVCVDAFHDREIRFGDILDIVAAVLGEHTSEAVPVPTAT